MVSGKTVSISVRVYTFGPKYWETVGMWCKAWVCLPVERSSLGLIFYQVTNEKGTRPFSPWLGRDFVQTFKQVSLEWGWSLVKTLLKHMELKNLGVFFFLTFVYSSKFLKIKWQNLSRGLTAKTHAQLGKSVWGIIQHALRASSSAW